MDPIHDMDSLARMESRFARKIAPFWNIFFIKSNPVKLPSKKGLYYCINK